MHATEIESYPHLQESNAGGIKSGYFHIAVLKCKLNEIKGDTLEEKLKEVIGNAFFRGKNPFVKRCAELIK